MKNGTRNVGTRLKGSRVIACIEAPCGLIKRAVVPRLTATTKSAMPRVEAPTANLLPRDGRVAWATRPSYLSPYWNMMLVPSFKVIVYTYVLLAARLLVLMLKIQC